MGDPAAGNEMGLIQAMRLSYSAVVIRSDDLPA
jgi:hypothetical protein